MGFSPSDLADLLFDETHWEKAAKTRMGQYLTHVETDFISSFVDASSGLIVDVGAETGRFSLPAANKDITVVSIDIDQQSLRRLNHKHKNIDVILADARKIPLTAHTVDAVFMVEVLDYIPESLEAVRECSRILKPCSPFILSFGNQSSLKAKLKSLRGKTYQHSYSAIRSCLLQAEFTITAATGYSWLPFGRISENRLVPFFASVEKLLGLRKVPRWSPWVILCARSPLS